MHPWCHCYLLKNNGQSENSGNGPIVESKCGTILRFQLCAQMPWYAIAKPMSDQLPKDALGEVR
jgi:hypothetical protein